MTITITINGPATITATEAAPSPPLVPALAVPVDHPSAELVVDLANHRKAIETIGGLVGGDPQDLPNVVAEVREHVSDLAEQTRRTRDLSIQAEAIAKVIGYGDDCEFDLPESVGLLAHQADESDQQVITLRRKLEEIEKERTMIAAALRWKVGGEFDLLQYAQNVGRRLEDSEKRMAEPRASAAASYNSPAGVDARQLPDEPRHEGDPGSPDGSKQAPWIPPVDTTDPLEQKRLRDAGLLPPVGNPAAEEEKPKRTRKPKEESAPKAPKGNVTPESAAVAPGGEWAKDLDPAKDEARPPAPKPADRFTPGEVVVWDDRTARTWNIEGAEGTVTDTSAGDSVIVELPDGKRRRIPAEYIEPKPAEEVIPEQVTEDPAPRPNPAAPVEVAEATKAIAGWERLPAIELVDDEWVVLLTETGKLEAGTITKTWPGTPKVQVSYQGRTEVVDGDRCRARQVLYVTPGGEEMPATITDWDRIEFHMVNVQFHHDGSTGLGVPVKDLRPLSAATPAQAS